MEDIFTTFFGAAGRGGAGVGGGAGGGGGGQQPGRPPQGAGGAAAQTHYIFHQATGLGNPIAEAMNLPAVQNILSGVQDFVSANVMAFDQDGWQIPPPDFLNQTHEPPVGPPPASRRVVSKMPDVEVTAEDLAQDSNDSCCICMEDHVLGSKVLKLPCGHIFHRLCITEWLERHCTCPTCRFECETEDTQYEAERRKRMKTRRLRFRQGELEKKPTLEIKRIMESVGLPTTGCLEKSDMIARLIGSGFVDIIDGGSSSTSSGGGSSSGYGSSPVEGKGVPTMKMDDLHAMPLGELRNLMRELGISSVGCCEKTEMVEAVASSGRVMITREERTVQVEAEDGRTGIIEASSVATTQVEVVNTTSSPAPPSPQTPPPPPPSSSSSSTASPRPTRDDLSAMSVAEVKKLMRTLGVSADGCLERSDLIRALEESGAVATS